MDTPWTVRERYGGRCQVSRVKCQVSGGWSGWRKDDRGKKSVKLFCCCGTLRKPCEKALLYLYAEPRLLYTGSKRPPHINVNKRAQAPACTLPYDIAKLRTLAEE